MSRLLKTYLGLVVGVLFWRKCHPTLTVFFRKFQARISSPVCFYWRSKRDVQDCQQAVGNQPDSVGDDLAEDAQHAAAQQCAKQAGKEPAKCPVSGGWRIVFVSYGRFRHAASVLGFSVAQRHCRILSPVRGGYSGVSRRVRRSRSGAATVWHRFCRETVRRAGPGDVLVGNMGCQEEGFSVQFL